MTGLHAKVLDDGTADLLSRIGAGQTFRDFYLAGGTGLALQLGHRMSLDLVLFSERPWSDGLLLAALRALGPMVVDLESEATAGLLDIACMKLIAVSQRGSGEP